MESSLASARGSDSPRRRLALGPFRCDRALDLGQLLHARRQPVFLQAQHVAGDLVCISGRSQDLLGILAQRRQEVGMRLPFVDDAFSVAEMTGGPPADSFVRS